MGSSFVVVRARWRRRACRWRGGLRYFGPRPRQRRADLCGGTLGGTRPGSTTWQGSHSGTGGREIVEFVARNHRHGTRRSPVWRPHEGHGVAWTAHGNDFDDPAQMSIDDDADFFAGSIGRPLGVDRPSADGWADRLKSGRAHDGDDLMGRQRRIARIDGAGVWRRNRLCQPRPRREQRECRNARAK